MTWERPARDIRYTEIRDQCIRLGLSLQFAKREGEAKRWGALYRVVDGDTRIQMFEADTLDQIQRWLSLEEFK
jgi:hypothetical protein